VTVDKKVLEKPAEAPKVEKVETPIQDKIAT